MEVNLIIIPIGLVLLAYLLYKEVVRPVKSRLMARILANVVMLGSFMALLLPISYTVKQQQSVDTLELVTAGEINAIPLPKKSTVYYLDSIAPTGANGLKAIRIADLSYYLASHPAVRNINIYGYGLNATELQKLTGYRVRFFAANAPKGFIACSWAKTIKETMPLRVQGTYRHEKEGAIKLLLVGLGKHLDSVTVNVGDSSNFSLSTVPKHIGKAVYRLLAIQGTDTLSNEPVPVMVTSKQKLNVLVLAASPDFEHKFLKTWLFENQYATALRVRISKDKYSSDFLNTKESNLVQVTSQLLQNTDVLIADEEELAMLDQRERNAIKQSVQKGMGLIIRIGNLAPADAMFNFGRYEAKSADDKPMPFKIIADETKLSTLPFVPTLFLKQSTNEQALVTDQHGKVLVGKKIDGMGMVVGATLGASYQWQLAGHQLAYATFWSTLISNAAKKEQLQQTLQFVPGLPTILQETRLVVDLRGQQAPVMTMGNILLKPRQNMAFPFEWDAVFWPEQTGWNTLKIGQKAVDFYVYQKTDWQSLRHAQQLVNNQYFVGNLQDTQHHNKQVEQLLEQEVSKWWFYLAFLLSISFLWYEQRVLFNK